MHFWKNIPQNDPPHKYHWDVPLHAIAYLNLDSWQYPTWSYPTQPTTSNGFPFSRWCVVWKPGLSKNSSIIVLVCHFRARINSNMTLVILSLRSYFQLRLQQCRLIQNPKSSLGPILAVESALEETKHTTEASTPQASGNWWPFADDGELPSDVKATWVETPRETGPWMSTHPVSMAFAR